MSELKSEVRQQYEALTNGMGICALPDRTQIEVAGSDRASFLHNFCTNDIKQLQPGSGCEAFFTNGQGKILAHAFVFCGDEALVIETVGGQAEKIVGHLDRYLIREDVELHDRSRDWGEILISGQTSPSRLSAAWQVEPPANRLGHRHTQWSGTTVSLRRVPITSAPCFLASCEAEHVDAMINHLLGQSPEAVLCSAEALEICRIEAGFPWYGIDITEKNLPQEVCRDEHAINLSKGCYLGQETVARIDALGHVNWHLAGVKFVAKQIPEPGTELTVGDKPAGHVTSAALSPQLSSPLALAYVRRQYSAAGTELTSALGTAEVAAPANKEA